MNNAVLARCHAARCLPLVSMTMAFQGGASRLAPCNYEKQCHSDRRELSHRLRRVSRCIRGNTQRTARCLHWTSGEMPPGACPEHGEGVSMTWMVVVAHADGSAPPTNTPLAPFVVQSPSQISWSRPWCIECTLRLSPVDIRRPPGLAVTGACR
jgi:hypothetical protein